MDPSTEVWERRSYRSVYGRRSPKLERFAALADTARAIRRKMPMLSESTALRRSLLTGPHDVAIARLYQTERVWVGIRSTPAYPSMVTILNGTGRV